MMGGEDSVTDFNVGVSTTLMDYWSSFAISGTPTSVDNPIWEKCKDGNTCDHVYLANNTVAVEGGMKLDDCDFWNEVGLTPLELKTVGTLMTTKQNE